MWRGLGRLALSWQFVVDTKQTATVSESEENRTKNDREGTRKEACRMLAKRVEPR
jgi:hypothetical protein